MLIGFALEFVVEPSTGIIGRLEKRKVVFQCILYGSLQADNGKRYYKGTGTKGRDVVWTYAAWLTIAPPWRVSRSGFASAPASWLTAPSSIVHYKQLERKGEK